MSFNTEFATRVLNAGGLAIKTTSSAVVKTVNTVFFLAGNKFKSLAAADMPALTGTIPTAYTSVYAFQVDSAGTTSVVKGNNVLTATGLSLSDLPVTDKTKAVIGLVVVANATGSDFTGGTTALDTASLTVSYLDGSVSGL